MGSVTNIHPVEQHPMVEQLLIQLRLDPAEIDYLLLTHATLITAGGFHCWRKGVLAVK
jgi:hypothetical protein